MIRTILLLSLVANAATPVVAAGAATTPTTPRLQHIEERHGPFVINGRRYTTVLRNARLIGATGPDSVTLESIQIRDAKGYVLYNDSIPLSIEEGEFSETCSASIEFLRGSMGKGFLVDVGCVPSAPLSGGSWQVIGVVNGKLAPFGKPLTVQGERGPFVPGKVTRKGKITQALSDMLMIRVWTGYFFVAVPVRVDWLNGKLALGRHCMYQTGSGLAEEGCEVPVEDAGLAARDSNVTFVRMFPESNERIGTPAHVVVMTQSKVEVIAGKVLITWVEGADHISLEVDDDVWVKVRIDGREGWIHTPEDLNAIGLYQSG